MYHKYIFKNGNHSQIEDHQGRGRDITVLTVFSHPDRKVKSHLPMQGSCRPLRVPLQLLGIPSHQQFSQQFTRGLSFSATPHHPQRRSYSANGKSSMDHSTDAGESALPANDSRVDTSRLTHLHPTNNTVRMVSIAPDKPQTYRSATATSTLVFGNADTLRLIREANMKKGDVLSVSRIAGICAAKKTADLIPMCHNIPLTGADVEIDLADPSTSAGHPHGALKLSATVKTNGQTGVEMDALTAVTMAGLTAYDMCKAVDKSMVLTSVRVTRKEGGRSGTWVNGLQTHEGYGQTST